MEKSQKYVIILKRQEQNNMPKQKYEDENKLRNYISDLAKHRSKKDVLNYIETKREHFSFSPDFISWCDELYDQLKNERTNDRPSSLPKQPPVEPLPSIRFNVLSEEIEREHLRITKKHIKNSESDLFGKINDAKKEMKDLRDDIRYSTASDRLDIVKEHLKVSHRKEDYQYEARFATAAIKNPYFGRFDFRSSEDGERVLYISKTNVSSYVDDHHRVNFIDWRSPIADMYYRYQSPTDDANFQNEYGERISGKLALTARFMIENGVITNIAYSSSSIDKTTAEVADEILQEKLESNSKERMNEIVETIQPEQNRIVRHSPNEDMIIQGVAGSGKTAVALHRIAYIVYQKPELKHGGVLFISPNDTFSDYVSDVLPELGEFFIPIMTFDQAIEYSLSKGSTRKYYNEDIKDFVEKYYKTGEKNKTIKTKFTTKFVNNFYRLCKQIEKEGLLIKKYLDLKNEIRSTEGDIKDYGRIIKSFERAIKEHSRGNNSIFSEREAKEKLPELKLKMTELKKNLAKYKRAFNTVKKNVEQQPEIFRINVVPNKDATAVKLVKTPLQYFKSICDEKNVDSDSYENAPFLAVLSFLVDKANGKNRENTSVQHIVIDEAQDYTEPYIYFLRIAYPNAIFTILGDINQNINPYHSHSSLEKLLPNSDYYEMDKAYRSSPEIVNYCNSILGITTVKAVRRSNGETVEIIKTKDSVKTIKAAVDYYRSKGYERLGVIARNQDTALSLKKSLRDKKLLILPVYQAKGLEYDAVVVIDEFTDREKELYYVACSRAQHGLTIVQNKQAKAKKMASKQNGKKNIDHTINDKTKAKVNNTSKSSPKPNAKPKAESKIVNPSKQPDISKTNVTVVKRKGLFSRIKAATKAALSAFKEE